MLRTGTIVIALSLLLLPATFARPAEDDCAAARGLLRDALAANPGATTQHFAGAIADVVNACAETQSPASVMPCSPLVPELCIPHCSPTNPPPLCFPKCDENNPRPLCFPECDENNPPPLCYPPPLPRPPTITCVPDDPAHRYFGSGSIRVGIWHVLRPTAGFTQFHDGNTIDDCGINHPDKCGQYPWSDPLTYPLPGSGWCDGIPGDFDYDLDYAIGGGFFPGGPWATDLICDYGYFPHHGAVPEIDDIAYPPLNSGAPAHPAFSWGADDTGLGQTGNPLADAGSGYIPTTDPWDAAFGDGQTCLTSGSITPNTDPDDWLDLCVGDASVGTICTGPGRTLDGAKPAGGDGGFVAFTLTAVTVDAGYFDWVPNVLTDDPEDRLHDHGGYLTKCDPTHDDYEPGTPCHDPEIPKEVFVTVAGIISS